MNFIMGRSPITAHVRYNEEYYYAVVIYLWDINDEMEAEASEG